MVKRNNDMAQTELVCKSKDYNVPLNHKARFFVEFMDEAIYKLGIKGCEIKVGKTPHNPRSMLKLIVYARTNHVTSSEEIEDLARYHDVYKYVSDYENPSARSIRKYKKEFKESYNELLKITLKKAEQENLTTFNHVPMDGTIKKAYNNGHNTITEKETDTLLKYYKRKPMDDEILEKLRRPVKKFMKNGKLSVEEKISKLKRIKEEFNKTQQEKIPLNDIESRKMKGKRGNYKIAYNIQSAVDSESKLICAITVSQSPTDHYELPKIADKTINNIGKKPKYISADTIYLNNTSLTYLVKKDIEDLIPNRKQSKKNTDRLNKNPYHKDHFEYNMDEDTFKCPEGEYLKFYKEYTKPNKDKEKPDIITRLYNNYNTCKNCKHKNKCISPKQTHRTISENGDRLQREMYRKMQKEENQKEFNKRPSVEGPFGPFKIQYNMEDEVVIGTHDTECYMTLTALAYNINRLYKLIHEDTNDKTVLEEYDTNLMNLMQTTLDVAYS